VPTRTQPKDDDTSVIGKMFSSKNAKMLDATALQAHELAAALRDKTMKPHPFDAYVLHARTGSLVCIGGFDAADDKQISVVGREIQSITFQELNKNKMPTGNVLRMFDHVFVMSIPRVN
jgi:hypothetical protein